MVLPERKNTIIISPELFVALSYSAKELNGTSKKAANVEPFDNIQILAKKLTKEKVKNRQKTVLEALNTTESPIVPFTEVLVYGL